MGVSSAVVYACHQLCRPSSGLALAQPLSGAAETPPWNLQFSLQMRRPPVSAAPHQEGSGPPQPGPKASMTEKDSQGQGPSMPNTENRLQRGLPQGDPSTPGVLAASPGPSTFCASCFTLVSPPEEQTPSSEIRAPAWPGSSAAGFKVDLRV